MMDPQSRREFQTTSKWMLTVFFLAGSLLIAISLVIPDHGAVSYFHELLKELGIVIFAVFSISLLYELLIADKYLKHFLFLLRGQIEQGESNAAVCAHLGIVRIFPARAPYEQAYPMSTLVQRLVGESRFRVVAKTMFVVITKTEAIKAALRQGVNVEFCILDPQSSPTEFSKSPDIEVSDLYSTLSIFRKQIAAWVKSEKPPGQLTLRFHHSSELDSYMLVESSDYGFCAWDLSFGRDLAAKRILVIDPAKPLGVDLFKRYDLVWNQADKVFEYDGRTVVLDSVQELFTPNHLKEPS